MAADIQRDTDADWQVIGASNPFFGVLANERNLSQNLTPDAIDEFYASGRADIDHVVGVLRGMNGGRFAPAVGLDFGCGVGRLSFAMAEQCKRVIAVDVAEGMLDVGREQARRRGHRNVDFRTDLPETPVDWINSLIVFQHIPPHRGHAILADLVGLLAPGGFVSIQLTFFRDHRHSAEINRDIADYRFNGETVEVLSTNSPPPGEMTMYDYDLNQVARVFFLAGITPLTLDHTDHGGCHGAWFFGVKRA
jgi:cyclopropane fatty-acyl-phospholipid synthase-like methyltransferase